MNEIDQIQSQWAQQRPDLNTEPMALIGRLLRVSHHLSKEMALTFEAHGMNGAKFDVLATLLRSGPPHALTPNQLLASMMITSGTLTNRLDQLEKSGLIARQKSTEDKRSVTVALTADGRQIIDETVTAHVATQERLTSIISHDDQQRLNSILEGYLAQIGQTPSTAQQST